MLAWFEHDRGMRGKGCVREDFLNVQKHRKDYRLEAKWKENDVKCFWNTSSLDFTERSKNPV